MNPNYPIVAARSGHICEYCHAPEIVSNIAFEVEHIIPLSRNGLNDLQNLGLSCRVCNLRKSDHVEGYDPMTQQSVRLFNPREDEWLEYFEAQTEAPYEIIGKTAIVHLGGKAAVRGMVDAIQEVCQQWK